VQSDKYFERQKYESDTKMAGVRIVRIYAEKNVEMKKILCISCLSKSSTPSGLSRLMAVIM
jgi:hypothetical protein